MDGFIIKQECNFVTKWS